MSHCPFVFAQGNTCGVPSFRVAERIELHKQHIGYVSTYRQKGYLRRRRLCQSDGLSSSRRSRRIFQRCLQILFACPFCRFFALLRMTGLCQFCTLHFAFDSSLRVTLRDVLRFVSFSPKNCLKWKLFLLNSGLIYDIISRNTGYNIL